MMQKDSGLSKLVLIFVFAIVILIFALGYFGFVLWFPKMTNKQTNTPSSPSVQPVITTDNNQPATPELSQPQSGDTIKSPVTIKGVVPPGWMNEGVFPIKILDSKNQVLAKGQANEDIPGSWQNGGNVSFTATITFTTTDTSGLIELDNDNPSGNPDNDRSLVIPVNF